MGKKAAIKSYRLIGPQLQAQNKWFKKQAIPTGRAPASPCNIDSPRRQFPTACTTAKWTNFSENGFDPLLLTCGRASR